jgi:cold shock CspA family protein/ribosome-associated translation inhibitor RaiA
MKIPLQITFRDFESSEAVEARVRDEVDKLERFHPHIISCRVVLERPHRHHHKGNQFHTSVYITLPGDDVEINRGERPEYEDIYVSIRDAFDDARRRLDVQKDLRRRSVKQKETPPHGAVGRLFPDHGFIRTADGRDVYFHRNSVLNDDFERLEVGTEVRFAEEMGDKGPQASTVATIGKHHIVGETNR